MAPTHTKTFKERWATPREPSPEPSEKARQLMKRLSEGEDPVDREQAADDLSLEDFVGLVPFLLDRLKCEKDDHVKITIFMSLLDLYDNGRGEGAALVPGVLRELRSDRSPGTRFNALQCFQGLLPVDDALPALAKVMVADSIDKLRVKAADVLGLVGMDKPRKLLLAVVEALRSNKDSWIRYDAARALGCEVGGGDVEPIEDPGDAFRQQAWKAALPEAAPALVCALHEDSDSWVRRTAAEALAVIYPGLERDLAKKVRQGLENSAKNDQDRQTRSAAEKALRELGCWRDPPAGSC